MRHAALKALMAVPEAALYLNDCVVLRKHDVGAARKRADMEAKAVAQRVERAARD